MPTQSRVRTAAATLFACVTLIPGLGRPAGAAPAISIPGAPVLGTSIPHWWSPAVPMVVIPGRGFVLKANHYAAGSHRGIDLRIVPGEPLRAPAAGVVSFMGPTPAGFSITVQAGLVRYTLVPVTPIPEDLTVFPGAAIAPGEPLVLAVGAGHPGCVSCVHFSVRGPAGYLDPMIFYRHHYAELITPR